MLANAEKQLQAATEALEQVRARARFTEAGLKTEKEDVRKALAAAKAEVDSATLRSPVAGMVASLSVVPGAEVKKDAPVALVEGSATLHAMVDQPARQPLRKGMSVDLLLPSGRKKYTFADDAKDGQAVVDLDNAKGELQLGLQGTAEIAGDDTNFLSRLLGR
jgi:multidrug resistance efflux pump